MKPKDTPTVETWSWLMFSLHLGCVLGLFLATYDLSGRLAEERLDLPFILPVLLVPPLVLLAGILGDRFRNRGLLAALSGICCWALLLFNIYFSIPYGLATPLFVLLFSITLVLYQSTLVEFSLKGQKLVAGESGCFHVVAAPGPPADRLVQRRFGGCHQCSDSGRVHPRPGCPGTLPVNRLQPPARSRRKCAGHAFTGSARFFQHGR